MEEVKSKTAVLHNGPTASWMIRSNMSKLKVIIDKVHQYNIKFIPEVEDTQTNIKHSILKGATEELASKLGYFIDLGNNIYSLKLSQSFKVDSKVKETETKANYQCSVNFVKTIQMDKPEEFSGDLAQEVEMVFNTFLRKVMEGQKLFPLKRNNYFDMTTIGDISETNFRIATGYFASISVLKHGLFLTIDTVSEIFKKTNCFDEIMAFKKQGVSNEEIGQYFRGKRVSVLCQKTKTIRVSGVNFGLTPEGYKIKPEEESLATIWERKYNLKVHSLSQPLLTYRKNKETFYLIPEFCYLTGLEEDSRQCSKVMNELTDYSTRPTEKTARIEEMFKKLLRTKALDECGLHLSDTPETFPLKMIPMPNITLSKTPLPEYKFVTKNFPIMQPIKFSSWVCIYQRRNFKEAETLINKMHIASSSLGIKISDPEWLELTALDNKDIVKYLKSQKAKNFQFALVLLSDRRQYVPIKKLLEIDLGITSQFVNLSFKKVNNLSIVSNIIKQINIKLGGEIYNVELPKEIPQNTMIVGIDVCHCGKDSVVGFFSNAFTTLSRCYCETALQKKGKEIISILVPFYRKALQLYLEDKKKLPDYILIFRDGVGRSQRSQVISIELPQVIDAIKNFQGGYCPNITLVLVNKRIHQRFVKEFEGKLTNPLPGTIIDDYVIEKDKDNFYLISATSRIGMVRPAHYHIAYNDKKEVTLQVIQKVCFAASYMYNNACAPVKVPAHITLADKKANLMSILKGSTNERLITTQSFI